MTNVILVDLSSKGYEIGGNKCVFFRSLVVVATAMAVCSAPAAMAVEGSSGLETDAYSVVELSEGESISIPEGYAAGVVEEDSSSQMFRSANTAPSCVEAKMEKAAVQVYNNCDAPMRIKSCYDFCYVSYFGFQRYFLRTGCPS